MACYEIQSCQDPGVIEIIDTAAVLSPADVIKPTPAITGLTYPGNCWTVLGSFAPPCGGSSIPVTSVVVYSSCLTCLAPPPTCYSLTSCDGSTVLYTTDDLSLFIATYISSPSYPGQCFYVAISQNCTSPIVFDNPSPCSCPCYTLTDCTGVLPPFNTISNLAAYVGQVIQIDENGGCTGPCFLVSLNPGPCTIIRSATVTLGCQPCPPCNDCYVLVDCTTKVPYLTLSNPTANGVDLSTLVGQVIGKVCLGANNTECTTGCWEVQTANCTGSQLSVYVYDTFATCEACNATCYKLTNCETLAEVFVEYVGPNATLPNISTLVGQTLKDICFTAPTGCLSGCWTVSINNDPDCPNPVDWRNAISYTAFTNCNDCLPKCYLLTECAPAVSTPIVVSNDLSLYVGQVAKICDANNVCHCYHVELSQDCSAAIVIPNANASFTTCEECNSCDCPPGYTKVGDYCQKITSVPATQNPVIYTAAPGSINNQYGNLGTRFYNNVTVLPYPLIASGGQFLDAATNPVPFTSNVVGVWSGPGGSRLNTVGIWTTAAPNPVNEWIGFSQCIQIQTSGTYCIGIGGDDCVRIKIDGVLMAEACIGFFDFNYWHVFEVNLTAGNHVIVVEGKNAGGPAAFGAEIYNATVATLQGFTTAAEVQGVTVFSTFPKRTDDSVFETGENSGYSCPPGYTYDSCNGHSCSLIETVPFVVCEATYRVKDCAGIQADVITNTDLSLYLTGTYRACINTQLQTPWPEGCYCVTVEQIDYETGVNFPAVFNPTSYNCCEDCLRVCYLLTDCQGALDPVVVCNDLAQYVGMIIQIEGCGDTCWQVALSQTCDNNTIFAGTITAFTTCEACLPPAPPAPILELHPRRIKPGYFSPNCKIPLSHIETVNCTFAKQVYDSMLILRYGITVCCDHDLPLWANRKAILDYEMLIDPSLCKSTLCYCPKPCLISTEITLLPTCVAPAIVSTQIDLPCPAPAITSVVIEYTPEAASCNCYTVTPLEQPIEMLYMDCCCVLQRVLIDNLEPITLCATNAPAIYPQPSSATVVLNGDCDAPGPCNPPTCYCWKVTNTNAPGSPVGGAYFDNCCTGPFCANLVAFVAAGQSVSNCSFGAPSVSAGLTVENMGPCINGSCDPPVCTCYQITSKNACEYTYTDCNGVVQVSVLIPGVSYVCSQTVPVADPICSADVTIISTSYPCDPSGTCGPPPPCVCYIVNITTVDGTGCVIDYTPCGGTPISQGFPDGDNYICSEVVPTQHPGALCTILVQSTPLDCALGECVSRSLPCNCYSFDVIGSAPQFQSIIDCSGNPGQIGGAPGTTGVACVQSFGAPNPNIIVSATPGACGGAC